MASKREVSIIIRAVDRATRTLKKIGTTAGQGFKRIAENADEAARSLLAVGAATTLALGLAVNTAAAFQQEMANTSSVLGATNAELETLTDSAREMGKVTVFSARQAAQAIYFLGSAGFDVKKIMGSLEGTLSLAAATGSDLAFSAQTVVTTLSAFDLAADESARVANAFAAAIGGSQATIDRLSTSLSVIGPVAESVNMSLEETTAVMSLLFNKGIDASTAGTALRQAIAQLLKPSKDATEALSRLSISVLNADNTLRPLVDIVRDLEEAGLSTADAMSIFGVRAGPAMLALVKTGADAIEDFTKSITGTNKAAEMAEKQLDTFQGQVRLLKSAFDEFQISVGDQLLPTLREYVRTITDILNNTSEWMKQHPILTEVIVKTTGVVSLLLTTIGGGLFIISGFTKAIISLTVAIGTTATGFIGAIGLAIVVMTAFIIKAKAAEAQARRTRNAVSGKFTAEDVISGVPEAVAEFDALRNEMAETTNKIIVLEQEIAKRKAMILAEPFRAGTSFEVRVKQMEESLEVFRARFSSIADEISKITIQPSALVNFGKQILESIKFLDIFSKRSKAAPPPIPGITDAQKKLAEQLSMDRKALILSKSELEIEQVKKVARERLVIAGNNASLREDIALVAAAKIAEIQQKARREAITGAIAERDKKVEAFDEEQQARLAAFNRFKDSQTARKALIDNLEIKTLESEGNKRAVVEARLEQELAAMRAVGLSAEAIDRFEKARRAEIHKEFVTDVKEEELRVIQEIAQKRQQQINDLEKERIASEGRVQDIISSMRVSAFQMEQNRINKLGQSYSGFIRSAISIGRQFFSEQEAGWIRALAATIRFVSRMVGGFLRGRALEKLKQAEQAKTASQALFQEALLLTKIGIRFALLLDFARASAAFAAAGQAASEAVLLSGQVAGLQTEAAGLMIAATAVEAAGAVAAGGLDLAADAVRRRVREEEKLARDTERRLDTELRLKQQIFELEGRTSEAKKLGIADEVSQLRELKVDENLIKQFEQLSIAQANLDTNSAGINTSASTNTMIRNAASDIANAGQIASSGLEDAVDSARRITRDGQDHFMDVGLELETTLTNLAIAVESAGQIAASGIQNVADAAQNINLGGNIVTQFEQSPIIDIIDNIGTALGAIAEKFTIAMESIKNAPTGIVDLLNSTAIGIDTLMNTIIADISEMANTAGEMIITGMQNISIPSIEFNDDLVKQFEQSPIVDAVKMIGDSLDIIVEKFITAMESIKDAGTSTLDLLSSVASNIGIQSNSIHDNVASIADAVNENILSGMQNIVIPNIEFDDDIIKQFDESPLVDSMDRVSDALDTIVEKFVISMESIKSAATGVVDFLKTITTGIEIQSNALQTQAIAMADMAKSIEMAGTIAASGIDQSTMAVNNATQQEIASNKETARQLGTELQLRQQIFNSEKDASASRQIAIENEISKLGQIGIDDSLQESLNQLSLSQTSTQITDAIMTQIRSQIGALESEAFVITNATKAIKTTGEAVASGIKLASDAALNATRQEMEHGREVERSLNTELQLRQRISVTEGQTFDARRLAIQDEMANFREMGIDENLLRRFERVATEQPQESTGVVVTDTGLTPAGLNSNTPTTPQTVVTQHNTFIGIADIEDQSMLREFARQLSPFLDDIEDLETSP